MSPTKKESYINIVTLTQGYADIKAEWATFKYVDSMHSLRRFSWLFAAQQVHSPRRFSWLFAAQQVLSPRRFSWLFAAQSALCPYPEESFFYLTLCWAEWSPWYVDTSSDDDPTWLRWGNSKQEELVVNQETGVSMTII